MQVCVSAGGHLIGKRVQSGDLIACSRCCNRNATAGLECNTKLCGIKSSVVG